MNQAAYRIAALYQFGHIDDALGLQRPLKELCVANEVRGTLIVAEEGVNGTIAGPADGIESVLTVRFRALRTLRSKRRGRRHSPSSG